MWITYLFIFALVLSFSIIQAEIQAGSAKVDATPPLGVPLAGYNHGARRVEFWPIPEPTEYTTFMTGNVGRLTPIYVKAVVISSNNEKFAIVTLDGIGADGTIGALAFDIAKGNGFTVPFSNVVFSASHTHSGPGAISGEFLWSMAPATDLLVPDLQLAFAESMAKAMVMAENDMKEAVLNTGTTDLVGVTKNRRARISPYVSEGTIDPHLGVIRVDDTSGNPIATVWNFAIHGVCYGPSNMKFSGDIMGYANTLIESNGGGVSLFVNADAGDIDPADGMCDGEPSFKGSGIMADAVMGLRKKINPVADVDLKVFTHTVDFGPTNLNFTLERFENCSTGGPLDICTLCSWLRCDLNLHLYSNWIETTPRFTGISLKIGNSTTVAVTMPGEPLIELGWQVRNDTLDMGYTTTFLFGYSQNHMGYFATPDEYDIGGYESQLTFWGIDTAEKIRAGAKAAAEAVLQ